MTSVSSQQGMNFLSLQFSSSTYYVLISFETREYHIQALCETDNLGTLVSSAQIYQ